MSNEDNNIMDSLYYSISEASERLGITYRTLHYYEQKLNLHIQRDGSGNRVYTERDIEIFEKALELKQKGVTLKGIKSILEEKGILNTIPETDIIKTEEKSGQLTELKEYFITEIQEMISDEMNKQFNMLLKTLNEQTNSKLNKLQSENKKILENILKEQEDIKRLSQEHFTCIDEKLAEWRSNSNNKENKTFLKKLFKK